jgi:hypothetical protein
VVSSFRLGEVLTHGMVSSFRLGKFRIWYGFYKWYGIQFSAGKDTILECLQMVWYPVFGWDGDHPVPSHYILSTLIISTAHAGATKMPLVK